MDAMLRKVQEKLKTKLMHGSERGGAKFFSTSRRGEGSELQADLNSNSLTRQKLAVKRIIANMSLGREVSYLFVDVVKLGATHNLELKKLVYLYILSTAKLQPDKALLAVNTFLQDANHASPVVRALALRTMLCVRVPFVIECTLEPLRKALQEDNPYVLKTAALALGKIFHLDMELFYDHNCLAELIKLLKQTHPMVVGNAAAVMCEVVQYGTQPIALDKEVDVLHLLRVLPNASEWAQVYMLELIALPKLIACIVARNIIGDINSVLSSSASYTSLTTEIDSETNNNNNNRDNSKDSNNHRSNAHVSLAEVVVDMVIPRLNHSSPAIVLAAIKVIALLAHRCSAELIERYTSRISTALSMFSKASPEVQYVLCKNVHALLVVFPNLLRSNLQVFFVRFNDPPYVKLEKMHLLLKLVTAESARVIGDELAEYSNEVDPLFVNEVIETVAAFALKVSSMAESCCALLLSIVEHRQEFMSRVLIAAMHIARKYPHLLILDKLIEQVEVDVDGMDEEAKVALVWTIGEYYEQLKNGEGILQHFIDFFVEHESSVQLATLCAVVKVFVTTQSTEMESALQKILTLIAEQSGDPDLRDRAFAYWRLLSQGMSVEDMRQIVYSRLVPVNVDHTFSDAMSIADLKYSLNTSAAVFARLAHSFLPPYGYSTKRIESNSVASNGEGLRKSTVDSYYVRNSNNAHDGWNNDDEEDYDDDDDEDDEDDEEGDKDKGNKDVAKQSEKSRNNSTSRDSYTTSNDQNRTEPDNLPRENDNDLNEHNRQTRSIHDDLFAANANDEMKFSTINTNTFAESATATTPAAVAVAQSSDNQPGPTKKVKIQNLLDDLFEHMNVSNTTPAATNTTNNVSTSNQQDNNAKNNSNSFHSSNSNANNNNKIRPLSTSTSNLNEVPHRVHDPFASLVPAFKSSNLPSNLTEATAQPPEILETVAHINNNNNNNNNNNITFSSAISKNSQIESRNTSTLDDLLKEVERVYLLS